MNITEIKGGVTAAKGFEAAAAAAAPTVSDEPFRHSRAPLFIVRLMFVPVSPSGTGKTLSSFISLLCISIAAAAFSTIAANIEPVIISVKTVSPY